VIAIILAGGQGKRMGGAFPKVLLPLLGRPILLHVICVVKELKPDRILVVGRGKAISDLALTEAVELVGQKRPEGTADAVKCCAEHLTGAAEVMVMCGDTPLITKETLCQLLQHHREERASTTILTAKLTDPTGYGRILRGPDGGVIGIVEERDGGIEELRSCEVNSGCYIFQSSPLLEALSNVRPSKVTKEYYLTDVIPEILNSGGRVSAFSPQDPQEILGVNTQEQYEMVVKLARQRLLAEYWARGVVIKDPVSTHIDQDVKLGEGTTVNPFSILEGKTRIGKHCEIGPFVWLRNAQIGDGMHLAWVVVEG
jgi:bifunctional UDP-N-acetylglucosamine pyrophosphorylase/glucosamine-1-phosphate N-acetyltransferase